MTLRIRRVGVSAISACVTPRGTRLRSAASGGWSFRGVRRAREDAQDLAHAQRVRIGQVKAVAVLPVQMGEMLERGDDEIDRDQISRPPSTPMFGIQDGSRLRIFCSNLKK